MHKQNRDRIIVVGGSGVYYGLDSQRIQLQTNRFVVNLGLYAGFGITSLLDALKPYVRQNDIIIIMPEYGILYDRVDEHARKWIFALSPRESLPTLYPHSLRGAGDFLQDISGLLRDKFYTMPKAVKELVRNGTTLASSKKGCLYYHRKCNENGDSLSILPSGSEESVKEKGTLLSNPG